MLKFKDIAIGEKPRERLIKYGVENLSNEELIMILLGSGTKKKSIKEVANNLLEQINDIHDLKNYNINALTKLEGIGKVKALTIIAALELGRRVYENVSDEELITCTNPDNIVAYFNYLFQDLKQEVFYVIYLDNKKKYLAKKMLFKGSINTSIVHPREIFKEAYLLSASFIICLHNHPSGDPLPSYEDNEITKRIQDLGVLHGINLVDHIIIGNNCYYSFYKDGKLNK